MKTTIDLADELLARAREQARRDGSTLRSLVEEGLQLALEARQRQPRRPAIKLETFGGKGANAGLTAEFQDANWSRIRDAANSRD